ERLATTPGDGIGRAFAPAPHTARRPGRRPADGGQVPWPGTPLRETRGHRRPRGVLSGVCPRVRAFTLTGEGGDRPPPSVEAAVRRRGGACRAPGSGASPARRRARTAASASRAPGAASTAVRCPAPAG